MTVNKTLLNTKTALDCDEEEYMEDFEQHNREIFMLIHKLEDLSGYTCTAECRYIDPVNAHKEVQRTVCPLGGILSFCEVYDCINGMDLLTDDEGCLYMHLFGEAYIQDGIFHVSTAEIRITAYDEEHRVTDLNKVLRGSTVLHS